MNILVFCDLVAQVPRYWKTFNATLGPKHELFFLVCNNQRHSGWFFFALQVMHACRSFSVRDARALISVLRARRLRLSFNPLGSESTLRFLDTLRPDLGLHAMGVIYRNNVIGRCGMGILNAHIGKLPKFRGRSVMEWALLCGESTGTTVFFIDEGIDTGSRIVHWEAESVADRPTIAEAKRHLFSKDAELYLKAVEKLQGDVGTELNETKQGLRFYEMSSLFKNALQSDFEVRHRSAQNGASNPP